MQRTWEGLARRFKNITQINEENETWEMHMDSFSRKCASRAGWLTPPHREPITYGLVLSFLEKKNEME